MRPPIAAWASVNGPKRAAAVVESLKSTSYWPGISVLGFASALRKSWPVTMGMRSKM